MIRLMLTAYNNDEVERLTLMLRDSILSMKNHCDEINQACDVCQYKHLCVDLASAESFTSGYAEGRNDTIKRYRKSR